MSTTYQGQVAAGPADETARINSSAVRIGIKRSYPCSVLEDIVQLDAPPRKVRTIRRGK
ncbi:hypothetical protein FBU59_003566 [Linderina macrospora]|uniref:Uncharacterized protein n=1 Tax=Linderina macrospora TaxID=4868 RepID=A0ACC1J847_9FUNG|nr:hypothetical protein FBU59_003566 [Linderina macrospora]